MTSAMTVRLLPATFVVAHLVAYAVTHTHPADVGHGHGYLWWTGALGAVLAGQALWSLRDRRAGARLGALVPAAILLYAIVETGERMLVGVDLGSALAAPAVLVGLGVQTAVAATAVHVLVPSGAARAPRVVPVRIRPPSTWSAAPLALPRSLARPAAPRRGPPLASIA